MNPPTTRRNVRMFLGLVGYCRQWIPNFSVISKPLVRLMVKDGPDVLTLTEKEMKAFTELRECMCRAPALDEGEETQRGDGEPITTEAPVGPSQKEVLPEADEYGQEFEPLTDPEGEGVEAEESLSVQTPPEQIAGPSRENTIDSEEGDKLPQGRSKTRETLKGDKWPELQVTTGKVFVKDAIEEEVDTTRREDLSEGELQGDRKLKRKRVANRRYAGPEWAYATSAEWQQEFLAFCFDREVLGQYFGT
ncbi:hypothetical protein NDU88_005181 [Pleurodeles waltl]|uniref:Uncharacterized protein n=1 Tax=Pleurodeles waltl TaxID=8319 RepID=A0AAV7WX55_PLEWA|nr:hypothetical protein NDU88_005181 [Pleurodeles waltl]